MSFRLKTILGVALIEAVLLSLLIVSVLNFLHDSHEAQMQRYSRATASSFAVMTADAVLAMDLARLESFAQEIIRNPGVSYSRIRDAEGFELAEAGSKSLLALPFHEDRNLTDVDDGNFDVSAPIMVAGESFGQVEIGLKVDNIQAIFAQTKLWSLSIASGEMVLVALFSLLLGTYLTRQLAFLKEGASRLSAGDLGYQIPVRGTDELAQTARAFNEMSQSLQTRTEQLAAVFALSPDGFMSLDSQGKVRLANPALCEMLGVKAADLVGHSQAEIEQKLVALSREENPFTGLQDVLSRTRVDADRPPEQVLFSVKGPPARVIQVMARTGDLTEVALLLHFRDVSREHEVDRMKSEFLSAAAHELRTPMASIYGFSELLMSNEFDEAGRRELLGIVYDQSALLVRIINELLDLARIEARAGKDFKRQDVNLSELVKRTLDGFAPAEQSRFSVTEPDDGYADWLEVDADPDKLRQALGNIVSNACKYSAAPQPVRLAFVFSRQNTRKQVGIQVIDQGMGMTPAQLERVFERFWRADASGQVPGTGLGMSLVKEIIELHHGHVEVQSTLNVGTTVTLWLPVRESAPGLPQA